MPICDILEFPRGDRLMGVMVVAGNRGTDEVKRGDFFPQIVGDAF